jgi:hypothetical protein
LRHSYALVRFYCWLIISFIFIATSCNKPRHVSGPAWRNSGTRVRQTLHHPLNLNKQAIANVNPRHNLHMHACRSRHTCTYVYACTDRQHRSSFSAQNGIFFGGSKVRVQHASACPRVMIALRPQPGSMMLSRPFNLFLVNPAHAAHMYIHPDLRICDD